MSLSELAVAGVSMRVGDKYEPRLSMRRIYNKKYFRDDRYRHEIGNHYRDFKMQQTTGQASGQLPHNHKRQRQRPQRRSQQRRSLRPLSPMVTSLASSYARFRGELPIHVHYFPRFGETYAPRGRQTICSAVRAKQEEPYNDTLRRIRSAHSCDQLKVLVQRQLA